MCGQVGQGDHTKFQDGPSIPGFSFVSHPGGHGGLAGPPDGRYEPVHDTRKTRHNTAQGS